MESMPKPALVVGLMSGTSADGVTAVLLEISPAGARVLREETTPYPSKLRAKVLNAFELRAPELSRLNMELGGVFAGAATRILRKAPRSVRVIGSHGQTIWHGPRDNPPHTLQLGEPAVIAERTGLPVVADFRPRDIAAGGQGAPLVPAFEEFLFASGPMRLLQNIGGIANVSAAGKGRVWTAFDTGPGNCLMDLAVGLATKGRQSMDKNGVLAGRGRPDATKVERLLKAPFFAKAPPKSLERQEFGEAFLRAHFPTPTASRLPDLLATLSWFTARSIADAYHRFVFPRWKPHDVIVSGGGAKNSVLMRHLKGLLGPLPVRVSDEAGLPAMAKEAACFAWMAWRALNGKTNNCPRATGARGRRILGKITR